MDCADATLGRRWARISATPRNLCESLFAIVVVANANSVRQLAVVVDLDSGKRSISGYKLSNPNQYSSRAAMIWLCDHGTRQRLNRRWLTSARPRTTGSDFVFKHTSV